MRRHALSYLTSLSLAVACLGHTAVSQTPRTEDQQQFVDRHYPFIEQGQEPPGHWVPNEKHGGQSWQGQMGWRTRHGEAIVAWSTGKPLWVDNALLPDGSRGKSQDTLDHGFRRKATGDRLWSYGKIDIRPDDVIFIDGEQPIYHTPPLDGVPNLEADLSRDPPFLAAMKDDRFAIAVLNVFENRSFYKGSDRRAWLCGLSQAAGLVADLRGMGESYQDYYPGHAGLAGTYPDLRPEIERKLRSQIDRDQEALRTEPPDSVRLEEMFAVLGLGHHSAEEVRHAQGVIREQPEHKAWRQAQNEKARQAQRDQLERDQQTLDRFLSDHSNEDVLEALRGHLTRLGWRIETEQDRTGAYR